MEQKIMTWNEWEQQFKPIQNLISNREEFNGWLFETYGEDLIFIHKLVEEGISLKVWTLFADGEYKVSIGSGYHHVNRAGYFVTMLSAEKDVDYFIADEDDKENETLIEDYTPMLANEFSKILNEWLHPLQIEEINAKNKTQEYLLSGACASHEYCDPNQAMIDAFDKVFGREIDLTNEADIDMTNQAWNVAKRNGFKVIPETETGQSKG